MVLPLVVWMGIRLFFLTHLFSWTSWQQHFDVWIFFLNKHWIKFDVNTKRSTQIYKPKPNNLPVSLPDIHELKQDLVRNRQNSIKLNVKHYHFTSTDLWLFSMMVQTQVSGQIFRGLDQPASEVKPSLHGLLVDIKTKSASVTCFLLSWCCCEEHLPTSLVPFLLGGGKSLIHSSFSGSSLSMWTQSF